MGTTVMPESRLWRRLPNTWLADTLHIFLVLFILGASIAGLRAAVQMNFRHIWIDLKSVTVPDHRVGGDPVITAYRTIHREFQGAWEVRIRRADDHRLIFAGSPGYRLTYRTGANSVNPLEMPLSEWIGPGESLAKAEASGFGAGRFYVRTCHVAYAFGFIPFDRCVDSNVFTRLPER